MVFICCKFRPQATCVLTCTTPVLCHSSDRRSASRCPPLAHLGEFLWTPEQLWSRPFSHRRWWHLATFYSQTLNCSSEDWVRRSPRPEQLKEVFGWFSAEVRYLVSHPTSKRMTGISECALWLRQSRRADSSASYHLISAWWCRQGKAHSSTDKKGKAIIRIWMFSWADERREEVDWRGARMPSLHGPRMVFLIVVVVVLGILQRETNEILRFVRTGDNQDCHHFTRHCKTPGSIRGRHCARRGASALSDSSKPAERGKNISTLTSEHPCVKKSTRLSPLTGPSLLTADHVDYTFAVNECVLRK